MSCWWVEWLSERRRAGVNEIGMHGLAKDWIMALVIMVSIFLFIDQIEEL